MFQRKLRMPFAAGRLPAEAPQLAFSRCQRALSFPADISLRCSECLFAAGCLPAEAPQLAFLRCQRALYFAQDTSALSGYLLCSSHFYACKGTFSPPRPFFSQQYLLTAAHVPAEAPQLAHLCWQRRVWRELKGYLSS